MKTTIWVLGLALVLALGGCYVGRTAAVAPGGGVVVQQGAQADDAEGDEVEIPLSRVPRRVLQAARARLPGIVIEEAERETENGITIYALEGEVGGKEYEIDVTADGRVLEVEEDEDEPGDEDGDDDGEDRDDDEDEDDENGEDDDA